MIVKENSNELEAKFPGSWSDIASNEAVTPELNESLSQFTLEASSESVKETATSAKDRQPKPSQPSGRSVKHVPKCRLNAGSISPILGKGRKAPVLRQTPRNKSR
jgi:hypothetical protein